MTIQVGLTLNVSEVGTNIGQSIVVSVSSIGVKNVHSDLMKVRRDMMILMLVIVTRPHNDPHP